MGLCIFPAKFIVTPYPLIEVSGFAICLMALVRFAVPSKSLSVRIFVEPVITIGFPCV